MYIVYREIKLRNLKVGAHYIFLYRELDKLGTQKVSLGTQMGAQSICYHKIWPDTTNTITKTVVY